jgi:hypothetical protein
MLFLKGADEKPGDDGSNVKNLKDKSEELMSKKELASKISKKKSELAPIIKELKGLREAIDVNIYSRFKIIFSTFSNLFTYSLIVFTYSVVPLFNDLLGKLNVSSQNIKLNI